MAKDRETVCKFYICFGEECKKGRKAEHNNYCQHCNKYEPRAKEHHVNMKKQKLDKIKRKEID